jgi:hypothetical protein
VVLLSIEAAVASPSTPWRTQACSGIRSLPHPGRGYPRPEREKKYYKDKKIGGRARKSLPLEKVGVVNVGHAWALVMVLT